MPAWSIGTARRGNVPQTTSAKTPGPGAYSTPKSAGPVIPKWRYASLLLNSIGKEQRSSLYKLQGGPGPGAYESRASTGRAAPRYSMAGRPRSSGKDGSPGPGQYQPHYEARLGKTSFGYSMSGRGGDVSARQNTPGPGAYNVASHKDKRQGTFGRAGSRGAYQTSVSPGPGAYTPRSGSSAHSSAPHFSFGTRQSNPNASLSRSVGPGPGAYDVKSLVGREGSKHTMAPRRPSSAKPKSSREPGPGAYNVSTTISGPKYKIGTARKCELLREFARVPGPGAYSPDDRTKSTSRDAPHWRMGTARKTSDSAAERTPGPGSYDVKERLAEGPSYAMRPKTAGPSASKGSPGPGQYDPRINDKRPPTAVIGRETRGSDFTTKKHVPGPGAYMYSRELTSRPAYVFGTEKKLSYKKSSGDPGPGYYKIPCTFADVPLYLIPNRSMEFAYV